MKKLFLGLGLVVGTMTFAQQFGIKGGANISSISDDGFNDAKSKVGFNAGVFMNAPLAESFSIQPEVLYNRLGSKLGEINGDNVNLNLDYISVPLMFQYNATPQFYLEAGPQFSFLTSAKVKNSGNDNESDDIKKYMNNFDFGVGLGAGYYFTQNIGLTARYVAGFTDFTKDDSGISADAKNKNNAFHVGLAYKF